MSAPKWALVIDENNKTSGIVKTKNLPLNNPSIRIVSLSSIITALIFKICQANHRLLNCYIALSVLDTKSALESSANRMEALDDNTDDTSSCSSDYDTSDNSSLSEDEVYNFY